MLILYYTVTLADIQDDPSGSGRGRLHVAEKRMMFTGWSMQGLLAGRKTQTRRLVNGPPRYAVGDSIVILEKWRVYTWNPDVGSLAIEYDADKHIVWSPGEDVLGDWPERMMFKMEHWLYDNGFWPDDNDMYRWTPETCPLPWRPPRYLPTLCARPERLTVTAVHAEPLHAITPAGCIAEGVPADDPDPLDAYRGVWETIHDTGSWRNNPDVYVYAFTNPFEKGVA